MKRYQLPQYRVPRKGEWWVVKDSDLKVLETTKPDEYADWDNFIYEFQQAPIRSFLPHGVHNGSKWKNDGLSFLNDWEHDLILLLAPNQVGKTTHNIAFGLVHGLIPLNPDWEIFKDHKVEYHEWMGPKILIATSY